MPNGIFVSYRRTDSQHASFAIADRLRWAFGADQVFLDRGSLREGHDWPAALQQGLQQSSVLVAVIGPAWLSAVDKWGRRRIDDRADWVRRELLTGLERRRQDKLHVLPVALDGAPELSAEGLDKELEQLPDIQAMPVRAASWDADLESLLRRICELTDLPRLEQGDRNPNGSPARPRRVMTRTPAMTDNEVRSELEQLPRWHLQWAPHPWGAGGLAQEIGKSFDFASFEDAIRFMSDAAREIGTWSPPHHPRWDNQWKVVNVAFSTWDLDCRVTTLDIAAARKFDAFARAWRPSVG